jgi:hypothetical protein
MDLPDILNRLREELDALTVSNAISLESRGYSTIGQHEL